MIVLLTGALGSGKTTACAGLVERARGAHSVGGVLAPAGFDASGAKVRVMLRDVAGGESRLQASAVDALDGPRTRRYRMDAAVLAWGTGVVLDALAAGCELVVVDEIGPIELEQNAGFAPALDVIRQAPERNVLLVVRPALVDALRARLAPAPVRVYALDPATRDDAPAELWRLFFGDDA